jgi:hypothetical protein
MLTSKEYLQQAEECLQLANASSDVYVKDALTELASDFKAMAKDLEQRNADEKTDRRSPVHLVTGDDLRGTPLATDWLNLIADRRCIW